MTRQQRRQQTRENLKIISNLQKMSPEQFAVYMHEFIMEEHHKIKVMMMESIEETKGIGIKRRDTILKTYLKKYDKYLLTLRTPDDIL